MMSGTTELPAAETNRVYRGPDTPPDEVPITLIGRDADRLTVKWEGTEVVIRPREPLPHRCQIRPATLFLAHDGQFPELNTVMGRLLFCPGATDPQRYRPYTHDPHRRLVELFLALEWTPDDAMLASAARWSNDAALAKRVLSVAGVPWPGLKRHEIETLVAGEPWREPLEGCLLHALTQWTHSTARCVIEIGSYRGQSLAILALALRGVECESLVISIDPHREQPCNEQYARLSLARIGEDHRLVQVRRSSTDACALFRPNAASLIFVDGDHSFSQVVSDFHGYRSLLAPGGCLVFHDFGYGDHNGKADVVPDVRPAIDKHVMTAEDFSPLLLGHTLMAFVKRADSAQPA